MTFLFCSSDSPQAIPSPAGLYDSIHQACTKVNVESRNFTCADEQIRCLLTGDGSVDGEVTSGQLEHWFKTVGRSVFDEATKSKTCDSGKRLSLAQQHKQYAEGYEMMGQSAVKRGKVMRHLNKAILWAPVTEAALLAECFAARARMHHLALSYLSELQDLERALKYRPNFVPAIESKVDLLKKLKRHSEAYHFVEDILKCESVLQDSSEEFCEQLKLWEADLLPFKLIASVHGNPEVSGDYYLWTSSCLEWNVSTSRISLKTNRDIAPNRILVEENPLVNVILSESLHLYCNSCHVACENTFWPCDHCTEVIFCSEHCAKQAKHDYHQLECGLIGLLAPFEDTDNSSQIVQVYRYLAHIGHSKLIVLDQSKDVSLGKLTDLSDKGMTRAQALDLFALSSTAAHRQITTRRPFRTTEQLTAAIYLFVIYCYKTRIETLQPELVIRLIRILATEMEKVRCSKYGWNETDPKDKKKRIKVSSYQCLVGSKVGHSCVPNSEWNMDGNRFWLTTRKPIATNEEITITFGASKSESFYSRLTSLRPYFRMCQCELCVADSKHHFALKCEHCTGPIPFDSTHFTHLDCLLCEQPFEQGLSRARLIELDFSWMQKSILLMRDVQHVDQQTMVLINQEMTILADTIPPSNRLLMLTVESLCGEYIRRCEYKLALEWHQWFVKHAQIRLPSTVDANREQIDMFTRFHNLDQWALAFVEYIRSVKEPTSCAITATIPLKYIITEGKQIFRRLSLVVLEIENDLAQLDRKSIAIGQMSLCDMIDVDELRSSGEKKLAQFNVMTDLFESEHEQNDEQ